MREVREIIHQSVADLFVDLVEIRFEEQTSIKLHERLAEETVHIINV